MMDDTRGEMPLVEVADEADMEEGATMATEPTVEQAVRRAEYARTLADVPPLVPEEQDPNVLFRHNWLARGQGVTLTASSGVGKSSMTVQTAFNWALGREWLAEPMRPLKCAIIQAEDSERDVAEQIAGMRRGLLKDGWSEEDFERARRSILCPTCFLGKMGDAFIDALADFQAETRCDMLFINPVQAFFGGDLSDIEDVTRWLRGGLDPILKNPAHACAAFLVTHTAKFTSGQKDGRANVEDYGEYIGAGAHEWTDWTRAKFVFLKRGGNETYFSFKAAKRGKRLGWTNDLDEATTSKVFAHSDEYIYWREVTNPDELQLVEGMTAPAWTKTKRMDDLPAGEIAEKMVGWIRENRAVTGTELCGKLKRTDGLPRAFASLGLSARQIARGGGIIKLNASDFRLQVQRGWYGFAEEIRTMEKMNAQQARIDATKTASESRKERPRALNGGRDEDLPKVDLTPEKPANVEPVAPKIEPTPALPPVQTPKTAPEPPENDDPFGDGLDFSF